MHRIFVLAFLSVVVAGATGCRAVTLHEGYEPEPPMVHEPRAESIVVTLPSENRPLLGRSRVGAGFLVLVPLVPYAPQKITPEVRFNNSGTYNFPDDLGETIAMDLRASGLAGEAFYTGRIPRPWRTPVANPEEDGSLGDYRLNLELQKGIWNRNVTLYGLSVPGFLLYFIGAPVAFGNCEIQFEATLVDADNLPIATETFYGKVSITQFIIGDPWGFMKKMPEAYAEISKELRRFLDENIP